MLIIKKTTAGDLEIKETGDTVPGNSQITIDPVKYPYYAKSDTITEIDSVLNSGVLVVNDGVRDLDYDDALKYLAFREALGIPFRSPPDRSNVYTTKNVQEAIEEVGAVVDPLVVPINLVHNGTLSNGDWIGYSNLLPGDDTPVIAPITGTFRGFTWSNSSSNADFALEFRKNTTGGAAFFTWSVDNTQTADVELGSPEPFTVGDQIFIKYVDEGNNASDAAIVLKFKSS